MISLTSTTTLLVVIFAVVSGSVIAAAAAAAADTTTNAASTNDQVSINIDVSDQTQAESPPVIFDSAATTTVDKQQQQKQPYLQLRRRDNSGSNTDNIRTSSRQLSVNQIINIPTFDEICFTPVVTMTIPAVDDNTRGIYTSVQYLNNNPLSDDDDLLSQLSRNQSELNELFDNEGISEYNNIKEALADHKIVNCKASSSTSTTTTTNSDGEEIKTFSNVIELVCYAPEACYTRK